MKIITISGKAQHGKDTSAIFLKEQLEKNSNKVLIIHFADYLKFVALQYFDWNGKKDEEGRSKLQYYGTDVGRFNNFNMWCKIVVEFLKGFGQLYDYVIIPDTRFPSEITLLKQVGFDVVTLLIERTDFDNGLTEEQKNHSSETALDNWEFDYEIRQESGLDLLSFSLSGIIAGDFRL